MEIRDTNTYSYNLGILHAEHLLLLCCIIKLRSDINAAALNLQQAADFTREINTGALTKL